jgi:concentrative nucleoside transporter, CNT family
MSAYITLGVPAQNLITASVMSIPASIAISKVRLPELEEPVTRGRVVVDRGEDAVKDAPVNALHAFAKGAIFGLVVAGQILCNVLTILSLVATINGLLTWIGRGFGIHHLTLQLVLRYVFYPITFFLGKRKTPLSTYRRRKLTFFFWQACPARRFCGYPSCSQPNLSRTNLQPISICRL